MGCFNNNIWMFERVLDNNLSRKVQVELVFKIYFKR